MNQKTIALIDPHSGGHHECYLRMFSRALVNVGCRVVVVAPCAVEIARDIDHPDVVAQVWTRSGIARGKPLWRAAWNAVQTVEKVQGSPVDLAFFAWLDSFLGRGYLRYQMARLFPRPYSGLLFQPYEYRMPVRMRWMRRWLFDRYEVLRSGLCLSLGTLDESVADRLSRSLGRRVVVFPDVAGPCSIEASDPVAQDILVRADGRSILLMTGVVDGRKGLDRFFQAASMADVRSWFFVIAGLIAWHTLPAGTVRQLRQWIDVPPPNGCVATQSRMDEARFDALIRVSSATWLAYDAFPYSSNLLSKSAMLNVPVVSNGEYLIGERVKRYHLGATLDPGEDEAAFGGHRLQYQLQRLKESPEFAAGCAEFSRLNSESLIAEAFRKVVG